MTNYSIIQHQYVASSKLLLLMAFSFRQDIYHHILNILGSCLVCILHLTGNMHAISRGQTPPLTDTACFFISAYRVHVCTELSWARILLTEIEQIMPHCCVFAFIFHLEPDKHFFLFFDCRILLSNP